MFDIKPWGRPTADDERSLMERTGVLKRPAPTVKRDNDGSVVERMGLRPKAKRPLPRHRAV